MKNLWTTITVKNMDDSIKFYNDVLGLELNKRYSPMEGMEIAFLGSGETKFELIFNEAIKEIIYKGMVSTGFQVDSVAETSKRLKEMNYKISDIIHPVPHIKFFFVEDPNGYKIQLVELPE